MAKSRRNILEKEEFLEGNRQKWAAVFTSMGLIILAGSAYGLVQDPAPFLQFFLSIGVTFILGASASDIMKAWKTDSSTVNKTETTVTTNNENADVKVSISKKEDITNTENININEYIREEGIDAPELKPFGVNAYGDVEEGEYGDFERD